MSNDSLEEASGLGVTLKILDRDVEIKPFTLKDFAMLRKHLKDQKVAEVRSYSDDLGEDAKTKLLIDIIKAPITDEELGDSLQTMDGLSFILKRQISDAFPEKSEEEISELMSSNSFMTDLVVAVQALNLNEEVTAHPPIEGESV